jgi:hypothetical protein
VITRLTGTWQAGQRAFAARDLSQVDYVCLWADGIHVNIRLEEHKLCLLVMIGASADGRKELIALADGYRESAESWADLLRDCARRGMRAPVLAAGDGALGFWNALREVFPQAGGGPGVGSITPTCGLCRGRVPRTTFAQLMGPERGRTRHNPDTLSELWPGEARMPNRELDHVSAGHGGASQSAALIGTPQPVRLDRPRRNCDYADLSVTLPVPASGSSSQVGIIHRSA